MSISIIGTPTGNLNSGDSTTAGAGTNRLFVLAIVHETYNAAEYITSMTFGAQAMTMIDRHYYQVSGSNMVCEFWGLDESLIPAGSQAIVKTGGGGDHNITAYTLTGENAVPALLSSNKDGGGANAYLNITNLATSTGGIALSAWGVIAGGYTPSIPTGFTQDYLTGGDETAFSGQLCSILTTGAAITSTAGATGADGNAEQTLLVISLEELASDTINPPASTEDGEIGIALNSAGFASGAINSVTVGGYSASTNGTTYDNPNIRTIASDAGTVGPKFGAVTIEASNGTETATADRPFTAKATDTVTDIATVDTSKGLYLRMQEDVGLTLATDDQILITTADGTISDDGNYTFASLPKDFYYYENESGKWYGLRMNLDGILTLNRKLHATKLTAVKMTAKKLEAIKL